MILGIMSDKQSGPAPKDTKSVAVHQARGDDDPQSLPDGSEVLEKVQEDLVKSGVRREQATKVAHRLIRHVTTSTIHSGPLPLVGDFAGYEQICPGAARDILDMAKNDQRHQQRMELAQLRSEVFLKSLAIFVAFGIILVMIAGAIYAAKIGHENLGITIASGSGLALVAGVIARIFLGRKENKPSPPRLSKSNKKGR